MPELRDEDYPRYEEIQARADAAGNRCFQCGHRTGDGLFRSFCRVHFKLVKPVYGGCMNVYDNCNAHDWGADCKEFKPMLPGFEEATR